MTGLQEYDLDIKPVHNIKGHGFCNLAVEAVNTQEEEEDLIGWSKKLKCTMLSEPLPLYIETLGTKMCIATLSMALCPLIFI